MIERYQLVVMTKRQGRYFLRHDLPARRIVKEFGVAAFGQKTYHSIIYATFDPILSNWLDTASRCVCIVPPRGQQPQPQPEAGDTNTCGRKSRCERL